MQIVVHVMMDILFKIHHVLHVILLDVNQQIHQ